MLRHVVVVALIYLYITIYLCDGAKFYLLEEQTINTTVGTTNSTATSFRLVSQDVDGFWVDSKTGTIYTSKVFDRESLTSDQLKNGFKFYILVGKKKYWHINVFITDVNDHVPYFKTPVYDLSVSEDVDLNTNLLFSPAVDEDIGNNALTVYNIVSGDINHNFRVHTTSLYDNRHEPYLTVISLLDLEGQADNIILNISACDAKSKLCRYGLINITVLDVNDHKPVFTMNIYYAHVNENSPVGTIVHKVAATDKDRGKNAKIIYKVGKNVDMFSINPDTGELAVHGRLDAEEVNFYSVLVIALDQGEPQLTSTAVVNVFVTDQNDNSPQIKVTFTKTGSYNVLEGEKLGTVVALMEVWDHDVEIRNRKVKLKLSKTEEYFEIYPPATASITKDVPDIYKLAIKKEIDRELTPQFNVKIRAIDSGIPKLRSNLNLRILVGDINDNAPQFSKLTYYTTLSESSSVGYIILNLTATDKDLGNNRKITFNIISDSCNKCVQISSSGALYLVKLVDREMISHIGANISAIDSGSPPLKNFTYINITILDTNDNDPYFQPKTYKFNLTENNNPNVYIGQVSAYDKDVVGSNSLKYQMNNSNFFIDSINGKIYATRTLDREQQSIHNLLVYVFDGDNRKGCAKVVVKMLDVNDEFPKFSQSFYNLSIHENFPVGKIAVYVTALDLDEGNNAKIVYAAKFQDDTFSIDSNTGGVILKKNLQSQKKNVFTFQVNAQDMLGKKALNTATVELHVLPASNLRPVFENSNYQFNVTENNKLNLIIGYLIAKRPSSGSTTLMAYSIISGNTGGMFKISQFGDLSVIKVLDYEDRAHYNLKIQAVDTLKPKLQTIVSLRVNVIDENDNIPRFTIQSDTIKVEEDVPIGYVVSKCTAIDLDSGNNARITIRMVNITGPFSVSNASGEVYTTGPLDYETSKMYEIYLQVVDGGEPSLSSEIRLKIKILDMNDNPPVFTNLSFVVHLNENLKVGLPITNITATDSDSGKNSVLLYQLLQSSDAKPFLMNKLGELFLKEPLDREKKDSYQIKVSVRDMGNPSQKAETWVRLIVEDFNDEIPVFEKSSYRFELHEELPSGSIVGEVVAIDKDKGSNAIVSYSLLNKDPNFVVSTKHQSNRIICVISSAKKFDSESDQQSYTMTVIATDHGKPAKQNRVLIEIHIKDINDHAPRFSQSLPYLATITEGAPTKTRVTHIIAKDDDIVQLPLEYSLILLPGDTPIALNLFEISSTGIVSTKLKVTTPAETVLNITIQVKEVSTSEAVFANYQKLIVIVAPSKPQIIFTKNCIHVHVKETMDSHNGPLGVELLRITDTSYVTSDFLFVTKDPNEVLPFKMLPNTGIITLISRVYHKSYPYYILNITAKGTRDNKIYSDYILLFIYVIPRNYYSPSYPNNPERYEIPEDWPPMKVFDTLKLASDKDEGIQGTYVYSIIETSPIDAPLKISPLDRQIMFTNPIDCEAIQQYVLKVRITDLALDEMARLSQTFTIYVSVKDVNDNIPVFLSSNYSEVFEDSAVGTIIQTVQAKDPDQGETNTPLAYTIISGNQDGVFTLDYYNGQLKIKRTLNIYKTHMYDLNIMASEMRDPSDPRNIPSYNSTMSIQIKVIDVNNKVPKFTLMIYKATIMENMLVGTFVIQVNSTDADIEPVNKEVVYELLDNNQLFKIHPQTGIITTEAVYDREQEDYYQVTVSVRNTIGNDDDSTCIVNIKIGDDNDNSPEFPGGSRLKLHILENLKSFEFHTFQTVDHDLGSNADVIYSISPNLSEFDLKKETGRISVTTPLDRENKSSYSFMITAQNIQPPFQTAYQNVTIFVDDENDEKPMFEKKFSVLEIYEDAPIHQNILMTLKATDKDEGSNAAILYSITSTQCPLTIDSNTGNVKLAEPLDYENITSYICYVIASGPGINFQDTTQINVKVVDTNDNYPQFSQQIYYVNVDKIQVSDPIFTVNATDKDENGKQAIQYSLSPEHDFNMGWFSGSIYISAATKLPPGHYRAHVTAKDLPKGKRKGQRYQYPSKRSQATILITVGNLTDSTLRFLNQSVAFNINESTSAHPLTNHSFGFLKAVSTQNRSIEYSITKGSNPDFAFAIRNTGELYVNNSNAVDHEKYTMFFLRILATTTLSTGSEFSILLSVLIKLNDLNDNAPVIFPQNITFSYPETAEENFQPFMVYYFHVLDNDRRDFQKLKFEIYSGNDNNVFGLVGFSYLYINKSIDYEKKQNYHIVLRATDAGEPFHHTYSHIYINLEDQNDNPPVFTNLEAVNIRENSLIGSIITTVTATDVDIITSTIRYGLVKNKESKIFEIDELTGVIKLAHFRLDYETKKLYTLNISAFDGIFTSYGSLAVHVTDDNDNIPIFTQPVYSVNVSRILKKNKHIIKVIANDLDSGMLGYISYKLDPKHLRDAFTIEQDSGNIFTSKDYTFPPDIGYATLSVIAFDNDGKIITRMNRAIVKMYISGKQSRNPVFLQSIYEMSIQELASRHVPVGKVTATFPTGFHQQMAYSIIKGNKDNAFAIGVNHGYIIVNNDLDREKRDLYSLELLAVVVGEESFKARCVVKITIEDVNDVAPVFLQDQYERTIPEDVAINYPLLQISAVDGDQPNTPNSKVKYAIHSGQDKYNWLNIDEDTGWVKTNRLLDRETTSRIQLTIVASDGNGNGHKRYVSLNVTLDDVNDNTPIFNLNLPIKDFIVQENKSIDTLALKVKADDPDEGSNGKVSYSIINSTGVGYFYMKDTHTGWVYTKKVLDYEKQSSYNLTILAYDHGQPRREASFEYHISIEDVNEFVPVFDQPTFSFRVLANAKKNTKIGKVSATDGDGGPAGIVRYTLDTPNSYFSISNKRGNIRVIKDLRTSSHASRSRRDLTDSPYNLVIRADNGLGTPHAFTKISIMINFTCPGCEPITTVAPPGANSSMNAPTMVIVLASVAVFVLILMLFCTVVYCRRKGCYLLTKGLYGANKNTQPRFCTSKEKVVGPSSSVERELLQHSNASSYDRLHFYTDCPNKHDTRLSSETGLVQDTSGGTVRSVSATDKASTYSFGIYHEQAIPESEMRPFSDNLSTMSNLEQDSVFAYSSKNNKKPTRSCMSRSTQESSLYSLTSNQPNANLNLPPHNKSTIMSSRTDSHESLNDFQEEGGGEAAGGIDVGNLIYAKLSEVDEEEPAAVMDGVRSFRDEGAPPSRDHTLSTIIGSDVALNYEGHYNGKWRPKVAPVNTVFSDLNHSKTSTVGSNKHTIPSSYHVGGMTPKQNKPSNDIPLQILNSGVLNSGRTSMLSSIQSLPRTPLEIPSTYTSGALSPNFTPAITPLVFRSPSVSSVGTTENFTTPNQQQQAFNIGLNKVHSHSMDSQLSRITLSDISVSDEEEQQV